MFWLLFSPSLYLEMVRTLRTLPENEIKFHCAGDASCTYTEQNRSERSHIISSRNSIPQAMHNTMQIRFRLHARAAEGNVSGGAGTSMPPLLLKLCGGNTCFISFHAAACKLIKPLTRLYEGV